MKKTYAKCNKPPIKRETLYMKCLVKIFETESRLVLAMGWGEGIMGSNYLRNIEFVCTMKRVM